MARERARWNVRAEASRRGLTQLDLATALGITRAAVSDRYRGRSPWTVDELDTLAGLFGVDLAEFFRELPPACEVVAGPSLRVVS